MLAVGLQWSSWQLSDIRSDNRRPIWQSRPQRRVGEDCVNPADHVPTRPTGPQSRPSKDCARQNDAAADTLQGQRQKETEQVCALSSDLLWQASHIVRINYSFFWMHFFSGLAQRKKSPRKWVISKKFGIWEPRARGRRMRMSWLQKRHAASGSVLVLRSWMQDLQRCAKVCVYGNQMSTFAGHTHTHTYLACIGRWVQNEIFVSFSASKHLRCAIQWCKQWNKWWQWHCIRCQRQGEM